MPCDIRDLNTDDFYTYGCPGSSPPCIPRENYIYYSFEGVSIVQNYISIVGKNILMNCYE